MFRAIGPNAAKLLRIFTTRKVEVAPKRQMSCGEESDEEFIRRHVDYFNRADIDGWDLRQGMNNIVAEDAVPHPRVIEAGLRACRRVNDIALAIRWLETCREKCGDQKAVIYPYLMKKITPVLNELGIPTLEECNYDKPELALKDVFDM